MDRVRLALQGADPGGHRVGQEHQAKQLQQAACGALRGEFEGAQGQAGAAGEHAPEHQRHRAGHHPLQQPHGDRQQQHAEGVAHAVHPGSALGQQGAAAGAEDHQRRTHAQAEGEQLQAAPPQASPLALI